jgi:hypothetical protein
VIFDRSLRTRDYRLSQLIAAIRASLENDWQPYEHIEQLHKYWTDTESRPRRNYRSHAMYTALKSEGAIFECGSGLTTLLLGLAAEKSGTPVMALEHDPSRHQRIVEMLETNHIHPVDMRHTPLVPDHEYLRYDVSGITLPERIQLIVSEISPQTWSGSARDGMVPLLQSRMGSCGKILVGGYRVKRAPPSTGERTQSVQQHAVIFGRMSRPAEINGKN